MANESSGGRSRGIDRGMPGLVEWNLGMGTEHASSVIWRCKALRAGRLYNQSLFGTRQEAEDFAAKMREVEPDQMFDVEAIKASSVWN